MAMTYNKLLEMTDGFSQKRLLGKGGYGNVYKGVDNGKVIAVKKLHSKPGLDDNQFENELFNLMKLHHQNIIKLVGYCSETRDRVVEHEGKYVVAGVQERALCLEYMEGGTLEELLSDELCGLDWEARYNIIKGICQGLKYLHTGSKDPIYHMDLKPANILLDEDLIPKIGDFGLSRLLGSAQTCVTETILGTRGYMPPEYIDGQQISSKFDVYSLGVIILQVIAGRENYYRSPYMPSQTFIQLVTENWSKRVQAETMSMEALLEVQKCIKIALRCVEANRENRPTVKEIVDELDMVDLHRASFRVVDPREETTPAELSNSLVDVITDRGSCLYE